MLKKTFLLIFTSLGIGCSAQCFQKGDMVADLNLGLGLGDVVKVTGEGTDVKAENGSVAAFSQKIAFEYGAIQFGKSTIGFGAVINNSYGFGFDTKASGSYDYSYMITYYNKRNGRWTSNGTKQQHRRGTGIASATAHFDDVNVLFIGSYHYELVKGLDTYATLGFGISYYSIGFSPEEGDDSGTFIKGGHALDKNSQSISQPVYYFNDYDHVKWDDGSSHCRLAMALYIGARYYFNSNWAINGEFGLTSASFKKDCNVYNMISCGVSYKF